MRFKKLKRVTLDLAAELTGIPVSIEKNRWHLWLYSMACISLLEL